MFSASEIVDQLCSLGVSHVIWVPDSTLGTWDQALTASPTLELVRVCREGEAWPLAAGLLVGGKRPVILMQCTGFFESGDAMRNIVHDLKLPVFAIIGVRNWLIPPSTDSAKHYAQRIANAWDLNPTWIATESDKPKLAECYRDCAAAERPGIVLMAEGKG